MPKTLLTERDIVNAAKQGKKSIAADMNTLITPAAKDKAKELKVQFVEAKESPVQSSQNTPAEPVHGGNDFFDECRVEAHRYRQRPWRFPDERDVEEISGRDWIPHAGPRNEFGRCL